MKTNSKNDNITIQKYTKFYTKLTKPTHEIK